MGRKADVTDGPNKLSGKSTDKLEYEPDEANGPTGQSGRITSLEWFESGRTIFSDWFESGQVCDTHRFESEELRKFFLGEGSRP